MYLSGYIHRPHSYDMVSPLEAHFFPLQLHGALECMGCHQYEGSCSDALRTGIGFVAVLVILHSSGLPRYCALLDPRLLAIQEVLTAA